MTLILVDGCEDSSSWVQTGSGGLGSTTTGRNGNCLRHGFGATSGFRFPEFASDTLTIGFAFRSTSISNNANVPLELRGDFDSIRHVVLNTKSDGALVVSRDTTTNTLGTTAVGLIAANVWAYIELQVVLHDTAGSIILRVNGVEQLNLTGLDTRNGGTSGTFDGVHIQRTTTALESCDFDDLYIMSGAGDSFMGDITVQTLYPNGNGNANQWIGSDGNSIDNYLLVDETVPATTDYVETLTSTHQDMYTMTDLAGGTVGSIRGVCHAALARTVDTRHSDFKIVSRRGSDIKSNAIDAGDWAAVFTQGNAWVGRHLTFQTDPETGSPWTIANVNALQSGVELV